MSSSPLSTPSTTTPTGDALLTDDELIHLTGYLRPSAQIKHLRAQDIHFFVDRLGRPRVPRTSLEVRRTHREPPGPNLTRFLQTRK